MIGFRPAVDADDPFLQKLFATTRERELAVLPPELRDVFIHQQFTAQKTHYLTYFPDSKHDIILLERDGKSPEPIGRLWVERPDDAVHIIDIALLPEHCGAGIGTRLLTSLIEEAELARKCVRIQVEHFNPALRLYRRLGFEPKGTTGVYYLMERDFKVN